MIDAYTIGVTLALEDGVSAGLAGIGRELATLDAAIRATSGGLDRLRNAAAGLDQNPLAGEASRLLQQTERAAAQLPRAAAVPPMQDSAHPPPAYETNIGADTPAAPAIIEPTGAQASPKAVVSSASDASAVSQSDHPAAASAAPTIQRAPISVTVSNAVQPPPTPPSVEPPSRATTTASAAPVSAPPKPTLQQLIVLGERSLPPSQAGEVAMISARPAPPEPTATPDNVSQIGRSAASEQEERSAPTMPEPARLVMSPVGPKPVPARETGAASTTADAPSSSGRAPTYREARLAAPAAHGERSPARSRALAPVAGSPAPPPPALPPLGATRSAAPTGRPGPGAQMQGDVLLDGTRMGRWIADRLGREASRPPSGTTGFDPRLGLAWPGAAIGP